VATYFPGASTPTGAYKWMHEVWAPELDVLAYEAPVLFRRIKDVGPTGRIGHIPKFDNLTRTIISESLSGYVTGLTFVSNNESETTFTPATSVVPVELTKVVTARMAFDPKNDIRTAIDALILQSIDADVLALAKNLTTNTAGDPAANLGKGDYLDAYQQVTGGAKQYAEPGSGEVICVVYNKQVDDLLNIGDFTSAQIRGDSSNPAVSGWVAKAFGVEFMESTSVDITAGSAANVMLVPRAMGIGFNIRPTIIAESYQIWDRIIAYADYAVATIRDQYACKMPSLSS